MGGQAHCWGRVRWVEASATSATMMRRKGEGEEKEEAHGGGRGSSEVLALKTKNVQKKDKRGACLFKFLFHIGFGFSLVLSFWSPPR